MERLTTTDEKLGIEMICKHEDCWTDEEHCPRINTEECKCVQNILKALKAYQDTGLTPEQIREVDKEFLEQAKALMRYKMAEKQGTIIRVPVAKGTTIWEIIDDGVDRAYIQGIEVQEVSDSRIWANDACFDYDDIGRTVFLRWEEAEAKMAEMEKQPDNKWIPISERLPEEWQEVLTYIKHNYTEDGFRAYRVCKWGADRWVGLGNLCEVLAWMPLPEPYEPDLECGRCKDE